MVGDGNRQDAKDAKISVVFNRRDAEVAEVIVV